MRIIEKSIYILGIPVALVCTDSLFLVLAGFVKPDPSPSTWLSMYMVDCLYGLLLFYQLHGFWKRKPHNRLVTAAVGGYSFLSFLRTILECILDFLNIQAAPITAKLPIFIFMCIGLALGCALLYMAFYAKEHWQPQTDCTVQTS